MAFDTGDDNGSETNKSTETTDNNESVDSEVSVESGDKGTDLVSNPESGLTGKDTELVEGNPIPSPSKSTELCESNEKKDNVSYSKSKNDTQKDSIKKANEKTEIANMSEEDIGKEDIFDKETGRFNTGYYGELNYNPETVKENLYITNGMMNDNPSKATQSFSNNLRSSIQENAIELKLNEDKGYFKQFGCDKETPSAIRAWFSNNDNYTLHETKENTIQIMDAKIHASIHHDGGVSQEKSEMISADSK